MGTEIFIENLRDTWSEAQIRRTWRGVLALQQPFPVAPVEARPNEDPGFTVSFLKGDDLFEDEAVIADINTEILNHLHAVIEFKVDNEGWMFWRISKNKLGEVSDWEPFVVGNKNKPEPSENLRNVWMKSHYVVLDPKLLPTLVYARVRDELGQHGGIKLYRNGFRVVPYGDPDNDWLRLDETYAKRSILSPVANRNFFGVVEIYDSEGDCFEERTSREGLIETAAFSELKEVLSSVLLTAANRIAHGRGRKTNAGRAAVPTDSPGTFESVRSAFASVKNAIEEQSGKAGKHDAESIDFDKAKQIIDVVERAEEEFVNFQKRHADEASMLRFLATLGMTSAEFSHETGMTFDAFRFEFRQVFEAAITSKKNDSAFVERAERAKAMLARLDTLTSYLNSLAGARAAREITEISVSKAIEDFEKGIKLQAQSQGINLIISTPDLDPLYAAPMHEAEFASLMLNLYTNSVKALKRSKSRREILLSAERQAEDFIRVIFSDSGDGIPEANWDKIFDPFFTTSFSPHSGESEVEHSRGTGLGLWIVSQIINNVGGEISVINPVEGYATSIEVILKVGDI